jgi:mRNA-degrading endonuclease RelE of RelBE toxin-antitoxin system
MDVLLTKEAQKQYNKLIKTDKIKIDKKILLLFSDSSAGKKLSGEFKGKCSLKAWPYRIIYIVEESKKAIWILSIIHRQGAYEN